MIANIGPAPLVRLDQFLNERKPEKIGMRRGSIGHSIHQQRSKRTAKHFMRGNVEADFLSREDARRELRAHQLFQDDFLARSADSQLGGKSRGEFHYTVIEKRRPHFERMRHAHAVGLDENIVRQKILLIEPQISGEMVTRRGQFG